MIFKDTLCPTCNTLLSKEQKHALEEKHKRGGLIGLVLGLIGAAGGTALGIYFTAIGG